MKYIFNHSLTIDHIHILIVDTYTTLFL